jgi:crotonobetainyl-CoA:carnitine CoA-transferase CaiB-like acyl-CoA transferase
MKVRVTDPAGRPVDLIGSPFHVAGADMPAATFPPRLGEHTDAVLGELLGLDAAGLAELRAAGVVA